MAMTNAPVYRKADLAIFNNLLKGGNVENEFNSLMQAKDRIVAVFDLFMPKQKLSLGKVDDVYKSYASVWMQFESMGTIKTSLNKVLKKCSVEMLGLPRFKITEEKSRSIRESHTLWLARRMRVGEFSTSYHSALLDKHQSPVGFISVTERDGQLISFITQDIDNKAKHEIYTTSLTNSLLPMTKKKSTMVKGKFRNAEYIRMLAAEDASETTTE